MSDLRGSTPGLKCLMLEYTDNMEFTSKGENPFAKTAKANHRVLLLKIWGQKIKSLRHWDGLSVGWMLMRHSAQRQGE